MVVGCDLLDVHLCTYGKVGHKYRLAVLVAGYGFNETVFGDDLAVSCGDVLRGIQAELDGGDFTIHTDTVFLVLFQGLGKVDFHLLSFIDESCGGGCDLDLLSGVGQLYGDGVAVQKHTVRCSDLTDFEFAEEQRLGGRRTVCTCGDGGNDVALLIAERTVEGYHIFGGSNLIDRTCQVLDLIHGLICSIGFHHRGEDLTGLGDGDRSFLRFVLLDYLDDGDAVFIGGVFLGHVKVDRSSIEDVTVGCLHLYKVIALTVRELFGCEERTVLVGVEGVDHGQRRVGVAHGYETAVGSVDLKACARIRDGLARSAVGLNYVEIGLEVCVVNEVAIYFAVLADEHLKGIEQLSAIPALDLSYHVYAVRQVDGFGIAELITGEDISLGGFGGFIAACALEIDFKHGTDFGSFDLGGAVIGMLDDGDLALDDILVHVGIDGVQLNGILACVGVDIIDGFVEQVSFGGADLTDRPFHVLVARIVVSKEISVLVCRIGVDERTILEYAVYCTFEGSIALGLSIDTAEVIDHRIGVEGECHRHQLYGNKPAIAVIEACQVRVELEYVGSPFLEDIVELDLGHLVPLNDRTLAFGNHVADGGVDFLHGVILADEDIFEYCHAVLVGVGVNADLLAGERGSVEMESHAFHEVILGGLDDLEVTALQLVVKALLGYRIPFDLGSLTVGNNISLGSVNFLDGVILADEDVLEQRHAIFIGIGVFVNLFTRQGCPVKVEFHAFHETVLGGLNDFEVTALQFVVYFSGSNLIPFDLHVLAVGYDILEGGIYFLQHVTAADKNIFEIRLSGAVHGGSHVNLGTAIGGAGESELDTLG